MAIALRVKAGAAVVGMEASKEGSIGRAGTTEAAKTVGARKEGAGAGRGGGVVA